MKNVAEAPPDAEFALRATQAWLQRAVIGLNLCPFAKAVQHKGRIRFVCSSARDTAAVRADLRRELLTLADAPMDTIETTLLVLPWVLNEFLDFNDFLDEADALLEELSLHGEMQIASFHPQYQFAHTRPDDVENATNRSPWPCLHLLREASIDRAVAACADPQLIYETNRRTLHTLGTAGWQALQAQCLRDAADGA